MYRGQKEQTKNNDNIHNGCCVYVVYGCCVRMLCIRCSWFVLFVPCTRLMKRGRKLVHEKIKKRKDVTCCVCVSLSLSFLISKKIVRPTHFRISSLKCCVYFSVVCLFFHALAFIFKKSWMRNIKNKRHALTFFLKLEASVSGIQTVARILWGGGGGES